MGGGSEAPGKARPRVCILHTGGTIAMVRGASGFRPEPGFLERYMAKMPELRSPDMPEYTLVRLEPLLDSADVRPENWVEIASAIRERYDDYDGFVVLHGTDTMSYTASALSFLLPGLGKPVILTGTQLSLEHVRSDGREHIITSLILAGCCGETGRKRSTAATSWPSPAATCRLWPPWEWTSRSTSTSCGLPVRACRLPSPCRVRPRSWPCACSPA